MDTILRLPRIKTIYKRLRLRSAEVARLDKARAILVRHELEPLILCWNGYFDALCKQHEAEIRNGLIWLDWLFACQGDLRAHLMPSHPVDGRS